MEFDIYDRLKIYTFPQVVPQFDSITDGDKDQRDPLNLSNALAPVS